MAINNIPKTLRQVINRASPRELLNYLKELRDPDRVGFCDMLTGVYRQNTDIDHTGSPLQAGNLHVHDYHASIDSISTTAGVPFVILAARPGGGPGAGEVWINYNGMADDDPSGLGPVEAGRPIIEFPAPTDTYSVIETPRLPANVLPRLDMYIHQLNVT